MSAKLGVLALIFLVGLSRGVSGAGYNESCTTADDCETSLFLVCEGDRCVCQDTAVYIPSVSQCRLKAGNECDNSGQECVPYSTCSPDPQDNTKNICTCKSQSTSTSPELGLCNKMSHDEQCTDNESAPCDELKFLQCGATSRTCECINRNETIFDPVEDTCKIKTGGVCQTASVPANQKCVDRSDCVQFQCTCISPFEENINRECTLPHGGSCNVDRPCFTDGHQACQEGTCSCANSSSTYYEPRDKTCYLLHGVECYTGDQECAPHSYCDVDNTRRCQCDTDLEPNVMRRCALDYDRRCDANNNLCDEWKFLECNRISSRCGCQLPSETFYEPISGQCELLANAPCSPTTGAQKCVYDSQCGASGNNQIPFKCNCIGSLESNKDRRCYLPFDTRCDAEVVDKCDPGAFIKCNQTSNHCECERNDMEYIPEYKACFILPGRPCSPVGENTPLCGVNAHCSNSGICSCNPGYESSGRGSCLRNYGESCNQNVDDCNVYKNIHCVNGVCGCRSGNIAGSSPSGVNCYAGYRQLCSQEISCYSNGYMACFGAACDCLSPSEQKYDPEVQKCFSLPGMRCNLNAHESEVALHCGKYAFCTPDGQGTYYGKCECAEGYVPNIARDNCTISGAATTFSSILLVANTILLSCIFNQF